MLCPHSSVLRVGGATALALAILASSPASRAEDDAPPHEGLYVAGSARGFYEQGTYSYDGTSVSIGGVGGGHSLHYAPALHGPGGGFDFAIGHSVAPGVALAFDTGIAYAGTTVDGALPWTSIEHAYQAEIGALVDSFPRVDSGFHLQAGLALAFRGFSWSQAAVGATDNVVNVESMHGVLARFGGGWSFAGESSLGLDLRFRVDVTRLWSDHSALTAVAPTIEVGVTGF
jgi:hypothetical protein